MLIKEVVFVVTGFLLWKLKEKYLLRFSFGNLKKKDMCLLRFFRGQPASPKVCLSEGPLVRNKMRSASPKRK